MTTKNRHSLGAVAALGIAIPYLVFFVLGDSARQALTAEDKFIENLGAVSWLAASVVLFSKCVRSQVRKATSWSYSLAILGLAVTCFLAFGEEISWGQRLFGVTTPASFARANLQDEINIHNLAIFQPVTVGGRLKTGWAAMLNFSRLFNVFWFALCVLWPLGDRWVRRSGKPPASLPVVPLKFGLLLTVNYFILKAWGTHLSTANSAALTEVFEANCAIVFLVISFALSSKPLSPPSVGKMTSATDDRARLGFAEQSASGG